VIKLFGGEMVSTGYVFCEKRVRGAYLPVKKVRMTINVNPEYALAA